MPEIISRVEMLQLHVSERKNVSVVYLSKDILFKCEVKKIYERWHKTLSSERSSNLHLQIIP